jgi:hypothetical protein
VTIGPEVFIARVCQLVGDARDGTMRRVQSVIVERPTPGEEPDRCEVTLDQIESV